MSFRYADFLCGCTCGTTNHLRLQTKTEVIIECVVYNCEICGSPKYHEPEFFKYRRENFSREGWAVILKRISSHTAGKVTKPPLTVDERTRCKNMEEQKSQPSLLEKAKNGEQFLIENVSKDAGEIRAIFIDAHFRTTTFLRRGDFSSTQWRSFLKRAALEGRQVVFHDPQRP
jgi:hypothetical protein